MLPAQAFFSGLQAISCNSDFYNTAAPCLQDFNTWQVASIVAAYGNDINGNKVGVFHYVYSELKKKVNSVLQFPRPDFNSDITVAALKTWFDANVPNNQLRLYKNLICIDKNQAQLANINGANYSDVLLNDLKVMRREYDPTWVQPSTSPNNPTVTPATHIYVYQGNETDYKIFTCLGDQTFAGNGYYGNY